MIDPKSRILVVDDMMTMRRVTIYMLKELGFSEFVEAADGVRAWELLNSSNPPIDIVISDVNMPNMTGLEFLTKVRASDKFKTLPFILVTTDSELNLVMEAIRSNVSSFILKPLSIAALKDKVNSAIITAVQKKKVG